MKKRKLNLVIISLMLLCAIAANLTACSNFSRSQNLMKNITPNDVTPLNDLKSDSAQINDFAIRLFQQTNESGKNTLISPFSVLCALAMTANGAEGETREQMEAVLGMDIDELNLYLYSYINSLPQGEKYKLKLANSIWFKDVDRFTVNKSFLQTNADYYGADIYKASFNKDTLDDINGWVNEETDGMIPSVLDEIPSDAIMYLINTVAFEAEWHQTYQKFNVGEGVFTKENGEKQNVELMFSSEETYIEDEKATGFIKYYSGSQYAFVALLPNHGVSVDEYVNSLNGETISATLSNAESAMVITKIPKFEIEYATEMTDALSEMGMPDAFNSNAANFSGIGASNDGNIFIGEVIHKTHIQVTEKGTKAGAATVVEMNCGGEFIPTPKEVYLDRPFVYMIIDCKTNTPFFIGTVMSVK